jgi:putative sigma-54 modulation protein
MNLSLIGHHVEITPSIRAYILTKLERIRRHSERIIGATIIITVEKMVQRVEILMHTKGRDIFVRVEDDNLYSAIDCLADKLDRQILRIKERVTRNRAEKESRRMPGVDWPETEEAEAPPAMGHWQASPL